MALNDGYKIPADPTSATTYYRQSGSAYAPYGYATQSSSGTHVNIPACNGSQTWTGTINVTGGAGVVPSIDDEGFLVPGSSISVTNLSTDVLAGMGVGGAIVANTAYNAVWNDLADCIEVPEETQLNFGFAYCFDGKNYYKSTKYMNDGYIGIHSDTAGMFIGDKGIPNQLRTASAGFVLAYVDKEYKPGTPLTCSENGYLTELKEEDIENNPHKIVGTYWKDEPNEWWGFDDAKTENLLVKVDGRKWIRVR